jgi:AcrR family transcriptional regulator
VAATAPYPRCVSNVDQRSLRKDAERSRAAILAAARELLGAGRDVPMYEIGRHAGVGQATLYRHFPDRSALVAALAREHVARIESIAAEHDGDDQALFVILDAAVDMLVSLHDVVDILRQDTTLAPVLHELRQRMLAVLETTLRNSGNGPRLRDDVGAHELQLVLNMVHGALAGIAAPAERSAAARRALEFALDGIIKPGSARAPARAGARRPSPRR